MEKMVTDTIPTKLLGMVSVTIFPAPAKTSNTKPPKPHWT